MFVTAIAVIQEENEKDEYLLKVSIIIQIIHYRRSLCKDQQNFHKENRFEESESPGNVRTLWRTLPNLVLIGCRFEDESN